MNRTTRREALGLAAGAAAWAAAGRLPLLGAETSMPVGLSPVQGYLAKNQSGQGSPSPSKLRYAVLRWTKSNPRSGATTNVEMGQLTLKSAVRAGDLVVDVQQTTSYSQPTNRIVAQLTCRPDTLELRSWRLKSMIEGRDDCDYEARGERDGDFVTIGDGLAERRFPIQGPLLCPWSLPLILSRGKPPAEFSLLDELLLLKPNQRIRAAAPVDVPFGTGAVRMQPWAHVGPGVLPMHYFVDEAGLPQLITQSVLAWALQEASA